MITSSAYFFIIHGSRNRETLLAATQLKQLLISKILSKIDLPRLPLLAQNGLESEGGNTKTLDFCSTPLLEIAALEMSVIPLSQSLVEFAQKANSQGCNVIKVFPLFLAPGVHVTEDIPVEISLAIKQLNNQITIELSPFIGKYSGMAQLLKDKFADLSAETCILVSHGSRLAGVADYYENLADRINAINAYWSRDPSLDLQVKLQIAAGKKRIAILPYFLFPGKITQAISMQVARLRQEYPEVELILGKPLGATEAVAELIAKEI